MTEWLNNLRNRSSCGWGVWLGFRSVRYCLLTNYYFGSPKAECLIFHPNFIPLKQGQCLWFLPCQFRLRKLLNKHWHLTLTHPSVVSGSLCCNDSRENNSNIRIVTPYWPLHFDGAKHLTALDVELWHNSIMLTHLRAVLQIQEDLPLPHLTPGLCSALETQVPSILSGYTSRSSSHFRNAHFVFFWKSSAKV